MDNYSHNNLPLVSVIIPCHNEEKFITRCLDSVIAQEYPKDKLEVLVVDGMSKDGTHGIVEDYIRKYSYIRLLDNPKTITPCGLNLGIRNATGELILWMSAHNEYEKEYVQKCIKYMKRYDADAVGGIIKPIPRNNSFIGKSICIAISHPFGVGNSAFKVGSKQPKWVDTAFGVCYKKEIFGKIGFFNEELVRGQDMEFSMRLKKAGLRTLLVPEIISYYYARSDLKSFVERNFVNGLWAILPFRYTNIIPISLRHLVPLLFVLSLTTFGLLTFVSSLSSSILLLMVGSYFLLNIYFSVKIAIKEKDLGLLFVMPIIFVTLHFSYGLGSLYGVIKLLLPKQRETNAKSFV